MRNLSGFIHRCIQIHGLASLLGRKRVCVINDLLKHHEVNIIRFSVPFVEGNGMENCKVFLHNFFMNLLFQESGNAFCQKEHFQEFVKARQPIQFWCGDRFGFDFHADIKYCFVANTCNTSLENNTRRVSRKRYLRKSSRERRCALSPCLSLLLKGLVGCCSASKLGGRPKCEEVTISK